jgi:hypothetical protein
MQRFIVAALAIAVGFVATPVQAERTETGGYDATVEVVIGGKVIEVLGLEGEDGSLGLHLNVNASGDRVEAELGPVLYIAGENFSFQIGDELELTGVRRTEDGRPVLWVRQLKFGSRVLKLRDDAGAPVWLKGKPFPEGADGCGTKHVSGKPS